MECQSVGMWEAAPAEESAVICIAPLIGSSSSLVHPHRREVSPLSRRVMLQPVSPPLQGGIRFLSPPYPHHHRVALRLSYLPFGRSDTGLPRSARLTSMGEVLSVRRWCLLSMTGYGGDPVPTTLPFWLKPVGTFGLFIFTTLPRVHMCSPYHASDPISAWCWQIHRSLAVLMPVW